MKQSFLILALLSFSLVAQTPNNVTGRWRFHGWIGGNDLELQCDFRQSGKQLHGSCTSDQGTVNINGQVKNSVVLWTYFTDYEGTPSTLQYTANLSGRTMKGKIAVDPDGARGEFTGTAVR